MTHFSLLEWQLDFKNREFWFTIGAFTGYETTGTSLFHIALTEGEVWFDILYYAGIMRLFGR